MECINDQNDLLTEVTIKRCVLVEREDPNYPDSKFVPRFEETQIRADVREVPMGEVAFSGGLLLIGDLVIFAREEIRGATDRADPGDPRSYADVLNIYGQEFVVIGRPLTGRGPSPQIWGWQANIRRRKTGAGHVL